MSGSDATLEVCLVDAGADDNGFLAEVVDLVNHVYADAERGLWLSGTNRTDTAEVAAAVRAGQLAVARLDDGRLVGVVKVQRLDERRGEFGMLVASPDRRGVGVGRQLVAFAERWARTHGLTTMQLELLVPQTWTHPVKEFLRAWYTRIGYRPVRTGRLAEAYPMLQPRLATPCDFVIYEKDLRGQG